MWHYRASAQHRAESYTLPCAPGKKTLNIEAAPHSGCRDPSSPRLDAARYSAAYEHLRACVVGGAEQPVARSEGTAGLGVLLQEGIPGWLKAGAGIHYGAERGAATEHQRVGKTTGPSPTQESSCAAAVAPEILPLARQPDLTLLIANMVVSTRQAVSQRGAIARTPCQEGALCR